jgi:hypothetical protein
LVPIKGFIGSNPEAFKAEISTFWEQPLAETILILSQLLHTMWQIYQESAAPKETRIVTAKPASPQPLGAEIGYRSAGLAIGSVTDHCASVVAKLSFNNQFNHARSQAGFGGLGRAAHSFRFDVDRSRGAQ